MSSPYASHSLEDHNSPIVCCCGMAWWKRRRIRSFLQKTIKLRFFHSKICALFYARYHKGALAIWASKATAPFEKTAHKMGVPIVIIEDGFIRSLGLGSGFLPPCSIIFDRKGAYVDPSRPSDLEDLLAHTDVSPALYKRAQTLIQTLRKRHISKYAASSTEVDLVHYPENRRLILVPGQVAGDLSVVRGGGSITNNLDLLKAVRHHNPEAWIIYRPHPDVEAGHRAGTLSDETILRYADNIHRGGSITALIEKIDEVHTLTSLAGFEALLREKQVTTYGAPFYAGWGLTTHRGPNLPRRGRKRDMTELVAISLILYPLYINPETEQLCEVEDLILCFNKTHLWEPSITMQWREKQGKLRRFLFRSSFISLIRRARL